MIKYFLLFLLLCSLFACKSVKNVAKQREVPDIAEGRMLKNVETAELDYTTLYAKRIDVSIDLNGKRNSLKASLKVKRDSFVQMSLTAPLGIEIARVLLTPDSVTFIDYFNKKYFQSDYNYFAEKFGISLGYDCFQKILTNIFCNLENCMDKEVKNDKFKYERTDKDYVLSNIQKKALDRKLKRFFKKKKKNKDYALVLQKIHIDPQYFRPSKLSLEDLEDDIGVSAEYVDFKDYDGKIFPEKIIFHVSFENINIGLELKFMKLEFNTEVNSNLRIPVRYKKMN